MDDIKKLVDKWRLMASQRENWDVVRKEISEFEDSLDAKIPQPHRDNIGGIIDFMNGV